MSWWYRQLLRPLLFRLEPEKAHDVGSAALELLDSSGPLRRLVRSLQLYETARPIELWGLRFPNAVGLAAGMDKNGRFWRAAEALGFGHVEIGTVTAQKQPGNPRPRLFRYPQEGALINRMGFNNLGAAAMAERLRTSADPRRRGVLGINLGKSRTVPLEGAAEDYLASFRLLADWADYITINVSSPNTPELRRLQHGDFLKSLLQTLQDENAKRETRLKLRPVPLLLKIAPDLTFREIDAILETALAAGLSGIVASNTTTQRPAGWPHTPETGGLSGKPLLKRSVERVRYIAKALDGRMTVIGAGGIEDSLGAGRYLDAGATLVQLYTGWIYEGPFLARRIAKGLRMRDSGWV